MQRAETIKYAPTPRSGLSANRTILTLSLCVVICAVLVGVLWGVDMPLLSKYLLGLLLYGVMTAIFIASRVQKGMLPVFEYPVFVSVVAFVNFGLAPLINFFRPPDEIHTLVTLEGLVAAFPMCVAGMVAFWVGSSVVRIRTYTVPNFMMQKTDSDDESRLLLWVAVLFVIGAAIQVLPSFRNLFDGNDVYWGALIYECSLLALIIVCIEINSRSKKGLFRICLWLMLPFQCIAGFFSGMKGLVLVNLLIVAMVTWVCRRKIPLTWVTSIVLGLICLYPIVNSYRENMARDSVQPDSVASAITTGKQAIHNADVRGKGFVMSGYDSTIDRLDMLSAVAQVQALGSSASFLDSGDRVWMIPFYAFVPRFLWKSKPSLNQGETMSILLSGRVTASFALTFVGDAYRKGGFPGVLVGMFFWGLVGESLVQFLYQDFTKARLFTYIAVALVMTSSPIEGLVIVTFSNMIKQFLIMATLSMMIYGTKSSFHSRGRQRVRKAVPAASGGPLAAR
jgi:hypothetical protein